MTPLVDLNRPYDSGLLEGFACEAIFGTDHNISWGRGASAAPARIVFLAACGVQRRPLCSLRVLLQRDAVEQWAVSRGALLSTLGRGNPSRQLLTGRAA